MKRLFLPLLLLILHLPVASLAQTAANTAAPLTVRCGHNFPPYEFLDENGNPTGFNVEMMQAVAEVMGLNITIHPGPWNEVRSELETGRIDALAGMVYSKERDRLVDFSLPHSTITGAIFARKGTPVRSLEDLHEKEIIVEQGDIMHDIVATKIPSARLIPVDSQEEALRLLASGRHDAALVSKLEGLFLARRSKLSNIEPVGPSLESLPYGFALRTGNDRLLAQLNEGLAILEETGRNDEIYERWFGIYEEKSFWANLIRYAAWIFLPLLLLLAGALIWTWTMRTRVAQKTRELERELGERQRAEAALRDSEERFRWVFETAAAGMVVISAQHKILQANPAFLDYLGYTEEELQKLTIEDVTHPDDRDRTAENYHRLYASDMPVLHYEKRYLRKDGRTVWGHASVSCHLPEGNCVGLVQDITARKRIEEALLTAHRQLEEIIDFLPDATFVIDQEKKVVAWNRAMEKLTGVPKTEMIGQGNYAYSIPLYGGVRPTLIDLIEYPDIKEQGDYKVVGGHCDFVEQYLPAVYGGKGAYVWATASRLFDGDGNFFGAIESIRDISTRKEERDNLERANRELEAFVYTVSHDLRSPLTPIIGYADFLYASCQERLSAQELYCLSEISASGQRMAALMEDLLTLAKVGHVERPEKPFDTGEVVTDLLSEFATEIAAAGVTVEIAPLPALRIPRTLVAQLFANLIGNALRYGSLPGATIEVGGERQGKEVRLYVRDHGPGVPPEDRERIFDVFYRGKAGREQGGGSGIGLATIQKIARLFAGRAWVEETPGGGSTFWVELTDIEMTGIQR